MSLLSKFLFFLQKQSLYFKYQDQILEILVSNPEWGLPEFSSFLQSMDSALDQQTHQAMRSEPNPFTEAHIERIKYGDADYPEEFTRLVDPPLVFSIWGQRIWKHEKIAIVGSRLPSQKSLWWLSKELSLVLSRPNVISVSGGAIGVDQLVHQSSISLKRPTVAILPSGLKDIYPRSFAAMSSSVLDNGGCLLSEFADSQSVRKHHFSYRNRLIAALGKFSIIVEAREKSGSLITAHRALEMGKDVFVVPGHPLDDSFRGSLSLLKMGAHIITHADDIDYWC